jgi:hypothetical protein
LESALYSRWVYRGVQCHLIVVDTVYYGNSHPHYYGADIYQKTKLERS